ncbi:cutinase family protein [Nocardia fluminea]|uniref:cutinase family protein n=1 Tax=Nocardia fluminea TaxID=134984 RepID=UPI003D119F78
MAITTVKLATAMSIVGLLAAITAAPVLADPEAAPANNDCADVVVLAVPGTWETNAGADRNTVPGMLGLIANPLVQMATGAPAPEGASAPSSARPATSSARPTSAPKAGKATTVRAEQIPYVAQVGGPIAGVVTGNPLTLKQSRENGATALETRAKELAESCPLTKFAVMGYSQGALVAGDFLSAVGNRKGVIDPSRVLAGALLSDPRRSSTTAESSSGSSASSTPTLPSRASTSKLSSVSETMVGPNVEGQGVLGERDGGMGVLAERVVTMCAENDTVCSLSGKSKVVAAVVPLLNLTPEDLPDYLIGRGVELLRNVASADSATIQKAASSVVTQLTKLTVASSLNPAALPLELADVVFNSTMLDDVAKVVNMPEFDALVSLTKPDELITQVTQAASYLLLDAHRSYGNYKVGTGDTATEWILKWLTSKIQAGL